MTEKVIIFIPAIENGGVERNAIWTANGLVERNYQVDVVYVRMEERQVGRLDKRVHQVKFDCRKAAFLNQRIADAVSIRKEFGKYLDTQNAQNTVILAFQSASAAIGVCKKHGFKVICRLSNHPAAVHYEKSLLRKLSEKIKPYTYKKADLVIANSKRLAEDFEGLIGKEVVTVYNPIDFKKIEEAKAEEIERELVEEAEQYHGKLLITVGRLTLQKDIGTLLRGFAASRASKECMLWIVGEGSQKEELEKLAEELKVESHVHFLGYQSNVYKYLKYADVFVQTSLYEGCPNALIEAVAAGLPAIATDCFSGPDEVLLGGAGGDLVPVEDFHALAKRIDDFFEHPEILKAKQQACIKQMARFESENVMQRYEAVLESVWRK